MPGPAWSQPTLNPNDSVVATIAVANATGGATGAALTLQCYQQDGVTPLTAARQIYVYASTIQYDHFSALSGTLTFGTATAGSIAASGAGWLIVQTDATGAFACTATNSADETLYFGCDVPSAGTPNVAMAIFSIKSNSDAATWSA